jgi:hypothetical protein
MWRLLWSAMMMTMMIKGLFECAAEERAEGGREKESGEYWVQVVMKCMEVWRYRQECSILPVQDDKYSHLHCTALRCTEVCPGVG